MIRPHAPAPTAPSPWLTLGYGILIACIMLGCTSLNRGVKNTGRSLR